jgi:hypothetical protein
MRESELVELLNRHAAALKDGRDFSPELAAHTGQGRELGGLLRVADRVSQALRPVAPRPAFARALKNKLVSEARAALEEEAQRRQRQWIIAAAGLGSLVYTIGLLALGIRVSLWLAGLIAVWLGWKKSRPVSAR